MIFFILVIVISLLLFIHSIYRIITSNTVSDDANGFLDKRNSNHSDINCDGPSLSENVETSFNFSISSTVSKSDVCSIEHIEFEHMKSIDFPHAKRYYVRGINPSTNRKKKELVIALSTDCTKNITSRSVMLPPYEVEEYIENPTENQITAAYNHNYSFPPDATASDASVIIGRSVAGKPRMQPPLSEKLVRYFVDKKIFIPKYADISDAVRIYMSNISLEESIAYFIMHVSNSVQHNNYYFLCDASDNEVGRYYQIADVLKKNNDFMRSFLRWKNKQIDIDGIKISKNTNAYKIAASYFE